MSGTITTTRIDPDTRRVVVDRGSYTDEFTIPNHFVPLVEPLGYDPERDQGRDGQVHLTYYDRENLFSYVWDGTSGFIEVAHGGYGEATIAHVIIRPEVADLAMEPDLNGRPGSLVNVFERHVIDPDFSEVERSLPECPECGATPTEVTEVAEVLNEVTLIEHDLITVEHKEWYGMSGYTLICDAGHKWPLPEGVEVSV